MSRGRPGIAARYAESGRRSIAIIGIDQHKLWAVNRSGQALQSDGDAISEFVFTTRLFANDLESFGQKPYIGPIRQAAGYEEITLVLGASEMDVFFWPGRRLAGALIRLSGRAVRLLPIGRIEISPGLWFHSAWLRDDEPPLEMEDVEFGGLVFEREVSGEPMSASAL